MDDLASGIAGALPAGGVDQQGRAFLRQRYEDVAVDLPPDLLLGAVDRQASPLPCWQADAESVAVLVRRLDIPDLEERAGRKRAVAVGPKDIAVDCLPARRRQVQARARAPAVFGTVVVAAWLEVRDDRGGRAQADVELLQGVRVDQVELNVLVAARFAGACVLLAEQVQVSALGSGPAVRGIGGFIWGLLRAVLLWLGSRIRRLLGRIRWVLTCGPRHRPSSNACNSECRT